MTRGDEKPLIPAVFLRLWKLHSRQLGQFVDEFVLEFRIAYQEHYVRTTPAACVSLVGDWFGIGGERVRHRGEQRGPI